MLSAALSVFENEWWLTAGAVASVLVFFIVFGGDVIGPYIRRWRLRRPCRAHFVIRQEEILPLPYVVQDDQQHEVRELVLPANSSVKIEIGYWPNIHFHEVALVFACQGKRDDRPRATERFVPFTKIGKSHWVPGVDDSDTIDIHEYYHVKRDMPRNVGTHFVTGFQLQTRSAGVFPVELTFFTKEIEGTAKLSIRVEDKPRTRMRCVMKGHHGCFVRPRITPAGKPAG